jgi:hypothetical protein
MQSQLMSYTQSAIIMEVLEEVTIQHLLKIIKDGIHLMTVLFQQLSPQELKVLELICFFIAVN